eukprot:1945252-Rhodomonas_salina.1
MKHLESRGLSRRTSWCRVECDAAECRLNLFRRTCFDACLWSSGLIEEQPRGAERDASSSSSALA